MDEERGERDRAVPASDELLRLVIESSTEFAIIMRSPCSSMKDLEKKPRHVNLSSDFPIGIEGSAAFPVHRRGRRVNSYPARVPRKEEEWNVK